MDPEPSTSWETAGSPSDDEEGNQNNSNQEAEEEDMDPVLLWATSGRRLLSGLLGLNVLLLGAALVAGQALNPVGLKHQEPQIFLLLLMGLSMAWMLWYLLWAKNQPGICPHKDHHAGGITVTVVLMLFAIVSLLVHIFRIGYYVIVVECKPLPQVLTPFIEAPFLAVQTYLLWAHSKDCIHRHKIITRCGLMVILCTDLLLWLNAVTDDTIHQEIELEKEYHTNFTVDADADAEDSPAGMMVYKLERRAQEGSENPTRSLDVMLLLGAALGQLALSYFSLVSALAVGASGPLASMDLSYSLLSLLELILQNIFIIEGLHRHPSLKKKAKQRGSIFKSIKNTVEVDKTVISLVETSATSTTPTAHVEENEHSWTKRATKEICAFLILSNIMLWIIPAFGANPEFENGLGKQFFGFTAWFVLVNLGQPLGVFYRMHSVGALMELLISA